MKYALYNIFINLCQVFLWTFLSKSVFNTSICLSSSIIFLIRLTVGGSHCSFRTHSTHNHPLTNRRSIMDHWNPLNKKVVISEGDIPGYGCELALKLQKMGALVIICSPNLDNCVDMGIIMTDLGIRNVIIEHVDITTDKGQMKLSLSCDQQIDLFIQCSDALPKSVKFDRDFRHTNAPIAKSLGALLRKPLLSDGAFPLMPKQAGSVKIFFAMETNEVLASFVEYALLSKNKGAVISSLFEDEE